MHTNHTKPARRCLSRKIYGIGIAAVAVVIVPAADGQTYNSTTGATSWNVNANWTPAVFPNAVGASATFNSPTGTQTVSLSAPITVGSITATNNVASVFTLQNGTGGSLILDNTGTSDVMITVNGTTTLTNAFTLVASTTLNDTLRFVNNTLGTGAATATITGTLVGAGGFTKDGVGRFTFSTVAKAYTGPTVIAQGRLRYTASGQSTGTSSMTVNSGGALYLDNANGAFSFGGGTAVVTINGAGDSDTLGSLVSANSGTTTLANPVALGSSSTVNVSNSATAIFQLNGAVSGSTTLTKVGLGILTLNAANAGYTGGTIVQNGAITVSATSNLGSGALSLAQSTGVNTALNLNNAAQTVSALSSSFTDTTGTRTQTITLTGTALTVNQTTDTTFGAGLVSTLSSSIAGTGSLIKSGTGKLTLTSANTYTGTTAISASGGTLEAGAASALGSTSGITVNTGGTLLLSGSGDRINNAATLTLSGGTFDLAGLSEGAAGTTGIGALTLSATSTLDFGTLGAATSIVQFAGLGTRTGILQVTDYDTGTDRLLFAGTSSSFTSLFTQSDISFNAAAGYSAIDFGAYYEIVPVPEPSAVFVTMGLCGLVGLRERRKAAATRRAGRLALA